MSQPEIFKAYIAVYLVLIKDNKILLSQRLNTGYQDGNYSLVAGHLDGQETIRQGIIREAQEEASLILKPEDLEVAHVMHRFSPQREYFDFFLLTDQWFGEIINMEPDKCAELQWFDINNLPNNMVPEIKQALDAINNKIYYSEFGWDTLQKSHDISS